MQTRIKKAVQITISEKCNLHCVYCYEREKCQEVMTFDTFKEIIYTSFSQKDFDFEEIEFSFHGGEIALFFDELSKYCSWLWSQKWPYKYVCSGCTNGTLVHGDIQRWFSKHAKQFRLGLSLDGTPAMHNANRNNSYELIDIDYFVRTWPNQGCKMTVSSFTLPNLFDGVIHLYNRGLKVAVNLAYGTEWNKFQLPIYRNQMELLVDYFVRHPELEEPNLLQFPILELGARLLASKKIDSFKWCGAGERMICYAPNGKSYPCQMFMPSANTLANLEFRKIDFSNPEVFHDKKCDSCALEGVCPTCCGQNFIMTGHIENHPVDLCPYRKIEALASSRLLAARLQDAKYVSKIEKSELLPLVKGILHIQDRLQDEVYSF